MDCEIPGKQMAICADCGHEKLHHTGGRGICGLYTGGGSFCSCNQYRVKKSRQFGSKKILNPGEVDEVKFEKKYLCHPSEAHIFYPEEFKV